MNTNCTYLWGAVCCVNTWVHCVMLDQHKNICLLKHLSFLCIENTKSPSSRFLNHNTSWLCLSYCAIEHQNLFLLPSPSPSSHLLTPNPWYTHFTLNSYEINFFRFHIWVESCNTYFFWHNDLQFHLSCQKWQNFILFNVWVVFLCVYPSHFLLLFITQWTLQLFSSPGYYE
jgi:hypothetical protein